MLIVQLDRRSPDANARVVMPIREPPAEITPARSDSKRPQLPGREPVQGPDPQPGWTALVALVRVLARQTAQQHLSQGD
jgi:hypothetical protein